jgi:hypothetical protein
MPHKQLLMLPLLAAVAIAAGLAAGFFELTIAGIVAAVVTVALWIRRARSTAT